MALLAALAVIGLVGGVGGLPEPQEIRYSHYWPAAGGASCARFVGGECVSRMASGERWQDWIGRGAACPPEYPFWTEIEVAGQEWVCLDRGGKVVTRDGVPFIDFLEAEPQAGYGTVLTATITLPEPAEPVEQVAPVETVPEPVGPIESVETTPEPVEPAEPLVPDFVLLLLPPDAMVFSAPETPDIPEPRMRHRWN